MPPITWILWKRRKVTLRELQSLIGLLNFTCSVIVPGRAFLRRLIDLIIGGRRPHHRIRLTKETKHDMEVWLTFLNEFNGRSFFLSDIWNTPSPRELVSYTRKLPAERAWRYFRPSMFFWFFPRSVAIFKYHLPRTLSYCSCGADLGLSHGQPIYRVCYR